MLKDEILRLLRSSTTGYRSGAELASMLKVSRTAVWKHVRALVREGFGINAVPSQGYRLISQPDILRREDLERELSAGRIGSRIRYHAELASTNTLAMELAQEGAAEGTVVIAERQTGGKGRLGRTWISPQGNLYLSVVLRPAVAMQKAPLITLMGAVAVASAIRDHGLSAGIKWPNDILIGGRKVSGLLTEMSSEPDRIRHVVLGIGVNVNMDLRALPADVRMLSSSLCAERGEPVDRTRLLIDLLAQLDRWYDRFLSSEAAVLNAWRDLNVTVGRSLMVTNREETIRGVAQDVDAEGRLVIRLPDGTTRSFVSGDVTISKNGAGEPDAGDVPPAR